MTNQEIIDYGSTAAVDTGKPVYVARPLFLQMLVIHPTPCQPHNPRQASVDVFAVGSINQRTHLTTICGVSVPISALLGKHNDRLCATT